MGRKGRLPEEQSWEAPIGFIRSGKVFLRKEDAPELTTGEYGKVKRKYVSLEPLEALYLTFSEKIRVRKGKKFLDFDDMMESLSQRNPTLFSQFLVYRDLRSRGYVVETGYGEGIDFLVYERGEYPDKSARYRVIGVDEGHPMSIVKLMDTLRFTTMSKKELKIAVVDRRGDVVYYSLKRFLGSHLDDHVDED